MTHAHRARKRAPSSFVAVLSLALFASSPACKPASCPEGTSLDGGRCLPTECTPDAMHYLDADEDGFGDDETATCAKLAGYVAEAGDCDDADAQTHPGANELCNGVDEDCDGVDDQTFACIAGLDAQCTTACGTTGTAACSDSCEPSECVAPAETCNGIDDDCDGGIDEDLLALTKGSSFGEPGDSTLGIVASPDGYVAFFSRDEILFAQPLDAAGIVVGAPIAYASMPRPGTVEAIGSTAFITAAAESKLYITRFSLETLSFDAAPLVIESELFDGDTVVAPKLAVTADSVLVGVLTVNAEQKPQRLWAVQLDPALTGPANISLISELPWISALRTPSFSLAAPIAEGAPWPILYFEGTGTTPLPHKLAGLSSLGKTTIPALTLADLGTYDSPSVTVGPDSVVVWTRSREKLSAAIYDSAGFTIRQNRRVLREDLLALPKIFHYSGGFVAAYRAGTAQSPSLKLVRYTETLDEIDETTMPAGVRDMADGPGGLAVITSSTELRPTVYVLGCP